MNVIRIHIPPLRERSQDIGLLMRHFLYQSAKELGTEVKSLKPETEAFLSSLKWPGNVRQLENTCRWLTVMASGREIHIEDLPPELSQSHADICCEETQNDWEVLLQNWVRHQLIVGKHDIAKHAIATVETLLIQTALQHTHGRKHEAALLLGYGRNTLTRKLKELDIPE